MGAQSTHCGHRRRIARCGGCYGPRWSGAAVSEWVVSCPYVIYYPTVMARYSLFVLKVPFKPQANKQTILWGCLFVVRRVPPHSLGWRDCLCFFLLWFVYVMSMCSPLALHNIHFVRSWHDIAYLCYLCIYDVSLVCDLSVVSLK